MNLTKPAQAMELRRLSQCWAEAGDDPERTMPILNCPRCIPIVVPDDLPLEIRRRAGEIVRGGSGIGAMKLLHDETSMSLRDGKALVLHLARRHGHCQRCDADIPEGEVAYCAKCKSLTITW
jgi:hypothetical protein